MVTPGRGNFKSQHILKRQVLVGLWRCGHNLLCDLTGQVRVEHGGPLFKNYEDLQDSDKQSMSPNQGCLECGSGFRGRGWGSAGTSCL